MVFFNLHGCLEGFMVGCRPFVYMKTKFTGCLLTTIALNVDNHIFPISFTYAEAENRSSWGRFLSLLHWANIFKDNLTFMSDGHLAIINDLNVHFFGMQVTFLHHTHGENLAKSSRGQDLKKLFNLIASAYNAV